MTCEKCNMTINKEEIEKIHEKYLEKRKDDGS